MSEMYKPLILIAVTILAFGLSFLAIKWPQSIHKTFSQHAAASTSLIFYYIGLFGVVLPLLIVFFVEWFVPTFHMPYLFTVCIITSCIAQMLCTFIPETSGWKVPVHRLLAGASALLLMPPLVLLAVTNGPTTASGLVPVLSLCVMIGVIAFIIINRSQQTYALIVQTVYFIAFFTPIIFISYVTL